MKTQLYLFVSFFFLSVANRSFAQTGVTSNEAYPTSLIGRWTFAGLGGAWDETETWDAVECFNGAQLTHRGLELKGNAYAKVELAENGVIPGGVIKDKTMIVWLVMEKIDDLQFKGTAMMINSSEKDNYDAIVYGNNHNEWGVEGNDQARSFSAHSILPIETGKIVKLSVRYIEKEGHFDLAIHQNDGAGFLVSRSTKIGVWDSKDVELIFGARPDWIGNLSGQLTATILAAELHNKFLSDSELRGRTYKDAGGFIHPVVALKPVNYPEFCLAGGEVINSCPVIISQNMLVDAKAKGRASITIMPGLADGQMVSLALNCPSGAYIAAKEVNEPLPNTIQTTTAYSDGTNKFRKLATFIKVPGLAGSGYSFESLQYPGYYLRHRNFLLELTQNTDSEIMRKDASFQEEVSSELSWSTEIPLDEHSWYVIGNEFTDRNKVLGFVNDGGLQMMDIPSEGSIDHLLWRLKRSPTSSDQFGLHNWVLYNKRMGETYGFALTNNTVSLKEMADNQFLEWAIRPIPWAGSDVYSITALSNLDSNRSLDCNRATRRATPLILSPFLLEKPSQQWRFIFMQYAKNVEGPIIPERIAGLLCGPNSVAKKNMEPPLNHQDFKTWYPKYCSVMGMDFIATSAVSDWAIQMSRTVITNVLLGLKDQSKIAKFKNYRIMVIGDRDTDINNYPEWFWENANETRGMTEFRYARITEEMMCRTGVTNRPNDNSPRAYDQVIHEFAHSIDILLELKQKITEFEVARGQIKAGSTYNPESFPWWVQAWYNCALVKTSGGTRESLKGVEPDVTVFLNRFFRQNTPWRPFMIERRYGK